MDVITTQHTTITDLCGTPNINLSVHFEGIFFFFLGAFEFCPFFICLEFEKNVPLAGMLFIFFYTELYLHG